MKIIKINLVNRNISEHNCSENEDFTFNLLKTDQLIYHQLEEGVLIYPKFINIEKCFGLKFFSSQLIMANAILVGGVINNYKTFPLDLETVRSNVYFINDKTIVTNELNRLKWLKKQNTNI